MRSCSAGSPFASLNNGTTIVNVGVNEDARAREPDLVDLAAILCEPVAFIGDLYRTGTPLSRPGLPGHDLPC
jgi:hypothetical protein